MKSLLFCLLSAAAPPAARGRAANARRAAAGTVGKSTPAGFTDDFAAACAWDGKKVKLTIVYKAGKATISVNDAKTPPTGRVRGKAVY